MEQLLEYENLVYSIINKYSGFDKDDLYQVGIMGLVQAYKNYNSSFNVKFSSYAYYYHKLQGKHTFHFHPHHIHNLDS